MQKYIYIQPNKKLSVTSILWDCPTAIKNPYHHSEIINAVYFIYLVNQCEVQRILYVINDNCYKQFLLIISTYPKLKLINVKVSEEDYDHIINYSRKMENYLVIQKSVWLHEGF